MRLTTLDLTRIRAGLYRIDGLKCSALLYPLVNPIPGQRYRCGGEIRIVRYPHASRDVRWVRVCHGCKMCGCRGWPTLHAAAAHAKEFFCA